MSVICARISGVLPLVLIVDSPSERGSKAITRQVAAKRSICCRQISAPVLQPGTKTKVVAGPVWPASITRRDTPSPTSTFRSRIPEAELSITADAFPASPAIKRIISRAKNFTAEINSRAGHRQREREACSFRDERLALLLSIARVKFCQ